MGNPSKPSNVKVETLKPLLTRLKEVQRTLHEPRNGGWSEIGSTVYDDLRRDGSDEGMQGNAAEQAGDRYNDNVYYIGHARDSLKGGVDTLVRLLDKTIKQHSKADGDSADDATNTNTSQGGPAGKGR